MIQCRKCGNEYPATSEFFGTSGKWLRSLCRQCDNEIRRAKRSENPEKYRMQESRYWSSRPDQLKEKKRREHQREKENKPEVIKARAKRYRDKNKDKINEYHRALYASDPIKKLDQNRRWRENNRDAFREYHHKRRRIEHGAEGAFSAKDVRSQYASQSRLCYWCSCSLEDGYHIDHVIPLSRGGSNWPDNLVCSCAQCNLSKGDKLPYTEWTPPNPL